jgi:signal transduction histidine kinase
VSTRLLSLTLGSDADVVAARQQARRIAELCGFNTQAQTRIATAVSEIARNAVSHGGGGEVDFALDDDEPQRLAIVVSDKGPGTDPQEALGGSEPGARRGSGLVNARRLVDHFEFDSVRGRGTRVTLGQRLPRIAGKAPVAAALRSAARRLEGGRPDPLNVALQQNRELVESLASLHDREREAARLNRELEETNRGVVALYSELDEKAEQLRAASEMKTRFLSQMTHEFRTPLNSVIALSRLLLDRVDGELNAEQARQVEYIRRSAQGLLDMVNDLLDLAKVEAGKVDVRPVEFAVEDLFAALRGALKPLQTNPHVDLVFRAAEGLPSIHADEAKVAQVLRNFIANALRFTDAGRVTVGAALDDAARRVVFTVEDTGIGIAPEHQRMIFDEYTQVDTGRQRGGTGLGLPLCRQLAALMGGEVGVDSEPGRGSTFRLALPLRFGEAAPRRDGGPLRRLLLVDDEESFRYVLRHIAEDAGVQVVEAADGAAGLALAREQRPDLVVMDLRMPRMDGFELLGQLRVDAQLSATPVIVCTSLTLDLEQRRALSSAYAIVPKQDVARDGLAALIASALASLRTPS